MEALKQNDLPITMPDDYANRFWAFISEPNERMKLKSFFENSRNYTIAVAVLTAGILTYDGAADGWARASGYFLIGIGGAQGIGCVLQSWVLFLHAFHASVGYQYRERIMGALIKGAVLATCVVLIPLAAWHLVALLVTKGLATAK